MDCAITEIFSDAGGGDRCCVLPEDGNEDEDGGDEDERECNLADGSGGEGFYVDFAARLFVLLFVPAGESGEEDETDEGEDDGDNARVC